MIYRMLKQILLRVKGYKLVLGASLLALSMTASSQDLTVAIATLCQSKGPQNVYKQTGL